MFHEAVVTRSRTLSTTCTKPRRGLRAVAAMALGLVLLVGGALAVRPLQVASASIASAHDLAALLDGIGYRIAALHEPDGRAPRLVLQRLPDGMAALDPEIDRKRTFLRALLPLVLAANEAVLEDRAFLTGLQEAVAEGASPSQADRRRVLALLTRYRAEVAPEAPFAAVLAALLPRVDVVPPSLALAQAAVESGWGTSRFSLEGNALFGQSSWNEDGMAPLGHDEPPFRVAAFASLQDCVEAYVANLNSHPAYAGFRTLRAAQRASGAAPDGRALAATLLAYAETGAVYTATLRAVIDGNDLDRLDHVRLDDGRTLLVMAHR